mmetsp:Transcript_38061/g.89077  ORF Transcript_38061/g.89077 Transcript_38061/m.89077 type:complete len:417 (+) Transcript_38061:157-1407(+)
MQPCKYDASETRPENLNMKKEIDDSETLGQYSSNSVDWKEVNELSQASVSTRASFHTPGLAKIFDQHAVEETESEVDSLSLEDLSEVMNFVKAGPLWNKLTNPPEPAEWARHGASLAGRLAGSEKAEQALPADLESSVAIRVYHLYLPMYFWMREFVRATQAQVGRERKAVVVGLSAPQGCGKSTAVDFLRQLFADDAFVCAHASIDDFYLTGADQEALAAAHPTNAILQVRGNAGTHDLDLGCEVLKSLGSASTGEVAVPVYDKAARNGKGDRMPESRWRKVETPCDVVLLEGWMSGFKAREDHEALAEIHPALPEINAGLAKYTAWDELMDGWCVVKLSEIDHVFKWRLEAEQKMKAAGRGGMSDDAVRDFVARYMPAYKAFCPALYEAAANAGLDGKPTLLVEVDGNRQPLAQ